jgi:cyanate permease
VDRINKERGDAAGDEQSTRTKLGYLLEWRLIVYGVLFGAATFPSYAFAYFLPVILSGGGYSTELALILSMPPNLFASIWIFVSAWASDKYKARSIIIVMNAILCIVGLLILGFAPSIGARYVGSFLGIAGCQANLPGVLALQANNILGHSKRAVGSAMIVGFGGVGGILASVSFAQRDFPRYLPG